MIKQIRWRLGLIQVVVMMLVVFSTNSYSYENIVNIDERHQTTGQIVQALYLEDPGGQLTIDDVMSVTQPVNWAAVSGDNANFSYTSSTFWLKFKVINPYQKLTDQIIAINYPLLDYVDYFEVVQGSVSKHIKTGDRRPYDLRPVKHPNFIFPINLSSNEETEIYFRVQSQGTVLVPLYLWKSQNYLLEINEVDQFYSFYYGVMFVIFMFNLFVFINLKEKSYFYYSMATLSYLCFFLVYRGKTQQLFFHDIPSLHEYFLLTVLSFTMLFSCLFARAFLPIEKYSPFIDRLIKIFIVAGVIELIAIYFLSYSDSIRMVVLLMVPCYIILFIVGPILWKHGGRSARYYTISWSFLTLGSAAAALEHFGLVPSSFFMTYGLQLGSGLESIIMTFALAERLYQEREEKLTAQRMSMQEQKNRSQSEARFMNEANKQLESKVEQRTKDLEIAKQEADKANTAKSEFLANMSHEIRTPMNAIIGLSHLALEASPNKQQKDYLSKINRSSNNLLALINNILDFSKIEAGCLTFESIPFRLDQLLEDVSDILHESAESKNLELTIEYPVDLPLSLLGDSMKLSQILTNLAGNAVKFTEAGEVSLKVERVVPLEHENNALSLRFIVMDTGVGMDEVAIEKLFHPFTQADSSTTRRFGGTGLGLTITKQLIELMHGEISVKSTQGKGSCFSFTLPLSVSEKKVPLSVGSKLAGAPASPVDKQKITSIMGARILLVEDNPINQQVASELLCGFGLTVTIANSGEEAVAAIMGEKDNAFDLILMDIQMPVMDGYEATSVIRANTNRPYCQIVPILAMTAHALESDKEKCLAAGMNGHLSKPIIISDIIEALIQWIKPKAQTAPMAIKSNAPENNGSSVFLPVTLPGIDIKRGLSLVNGNRALYLSLLHEFREKYVTFSVELSNAITTNDINTFKSLIHNITSVAGNIGATELSVHAQELEDTLKHDEITNKGLSQDVSHNIKIETLLQSLKKVLASVSDIKIDQQTNTDEYKAADSIVNRTQQLKIIDSLQSLVSDNSSRAVDMLPGLRTMLNGRHTELYDSIVSNVREFEFEQAERQLTKLKVLLH